MCRTAGGTPSSSFYDIVAADFVASDTSGTCAHQIRDGFVALLAALKSDRLADVTKAFRLCDPLSATDDRDAFVGLVQSFFGTLAELDYPYAVDFAGSSLPGHPVDVACARLAAVPVSNAMLRLAAAASVAFNASGTSKCLQVPKNAVFEQFLPGLMDGAWTYQRCTEVRACARASMCAMDDNLV